MISGYEAADSDGGAWTALIIPVIAIVIIGIAATFVVGRIASRGRRRAASEARSDAIQRAAEAQGWSFQRRAPALERAWKQGPFIRGDFRIATNAVRGEHRGWEFVAFEFVISSDEAGSTHFVVYAITLPGALPTTAVGPEGVFGGRIARGLGFGDLQLGEQDLDTAWKIRTKDEQFGRALFQDRMRLLLRETDVWSWGFEGNTMLSYHEGYMAVENIRSRLDLMLRVIRQVPDNAWLTVPEGM